MTPRILVVDDTEFVRRNLIKIIIASGWEVVGEAETGEEAIERYLALKPDLVTMDITMPGSRLDGIEATRAILEEDPAARILMCSAVGQLDKVQEAVAAGAKDHITKPFQKDRVVERIRAALGS
ncbi:MAG: response regulator [Candidatus Sericytochromatia bacterium]|nr:response regulator [Candidatus Tanganyikabacteria bacterium]